jgi:GAF domain-containing protein
MERLRLIAGSSADRGARARDAAELIRAAGGYRWVGLYEVTASHIAAIAWTGPEAPAHPTFPRAQGLNGAAVASAAPVIVQDVRKDPRYLTTFGSTRAEAIFPVSIPEQGVVGTIDVESEEVGAFGVDDERFLLACADALRGLWTKDAPARP